MATGPQIPGHSRREALIAFGAVGFGAAYGLRDVVIPEVADGASACLLQPVVALPEPPRLLPRGAQWRGRR